MQSSSSINSCLNILRRTPVCDVEQNVNTMSILLEDEAVSDELYQRVDCPLKHASDPLAENKKYLLSDHNRDGESHRSPWSNTYQPPLPTNNEGFKPSEALRQLELQANDIFNSYKDLYYGKDAISSVYFWDHESGSNNRFAGSFLIKKDIGDDDDDAHDRLQCGCWNSIHVVEVKVEPSGKTNYKLVTTVIVSMNVSLPSDGNTTTTNTVKIDGSLTKTTETIQSITDGTNATFSSQHIINIGKMIEDMEIDLRSSIDGLYIQKTKEIVETIRCENSSKQKHSLMAAMMTERLQK